MHSKNHLSLNAPHEDLALVRRILAGGDDAWKRFVTRFSERIWKRAWNLCGEYCHKIYSAVSCVFLRVKNGRPTGSRQEGCDDGVEIYAFILEYFFNMETKNGKLKFYDGRSRLETFVNAVLYGHLRNDWIRHHRHIREHAIARPAEIRKLPESHQLVFDQMVLRRSTEAIAKKLDMPLAEILSIRERIEHCLVSNGNLHLIRSSLDEAEPELDGLKSPEDDVPLASALGNLWNTVCNIVSKLPGNKRILLDMAFNQALGAKDMTRQCAELNLDLPVKPRGGEITIHTIYQSIDMVLLEVGKILTTDYRECVNRCQDFLNHEDVSCSGSSDIGTRGLKELLKNMGLEVRSVPAHQPAGGNDESE